MSKKQTNYKVVRELIAFASATEGDIASMSKAEVNERLASQGINPDELHKAASRHLKTIENAMAALEAAKQADRKSKKPTIPVNVRQMALAARTDVQADEGDLETLWKLSQPDEEDGPED